MSAGAGQPGKSRRAPRHTAAPAVPGAVLALLVGSLSSSMDVAGAALPAYTTALLCECPGGVSRFRQWQRSAYPTNVLQTAGLGAHPLPAATAGLHAPPPSPLTDFSGFLIPFSKIP